MKKLFFHTRHLGLLALLLTLTMGLHAQQEVLIWCSLTRNTLPDAPIVTAAPNPVSELVRLIPAEEVEMEELTIYDGSSNLVFSASLGTGCQHQATLDPGLHYFHVKTDVGTIIIPVEIL